MDQSDLGLRYRFAQGVVREAGQVALDRYRRRESLTIERKGRQDFVSEADKACEEFVIGALLKAFPAMPSLAKRAVRRIPAAPPSGSSIRSTAPAISWPASRSGACRWAWSSAANRCWASSTIR
jgi:hypothetical protein